MSDLVWRTTPIARSVFEAVADAAARHGKGRTAVEDPLSGKLSYRRLLAGAAVLGRKLAPLAAEGEAVRRAAADRERRRRHRARPRSRPAGSRRC